MNYVICDNCKKSNRIIINTNPLYCYKCANCSEPLNIKKAKKYILHNNQRKLNRYKNEQTSRENFNKSLDKIKLFLSLLIGISLIYLYHHFREDNATVETKTINKISIGNPKSGILLNTINGNNVATFKVLTKGYFNHYLKLTSLYSQEKFITIFINSQDSISVKIPLGIYTLKYASGTQWYGIDDKFGKQGKYKQVDKYLNFYIKDNIINGKTIKLYPVYNGNLPEVVIGKNNF